MSKLQRSTSPDTNPSSPNPSSMPRFQILRPPQSPSSPQATSPSSPQPQTASPELPSPTHSPSPRSTTPPQLALSSEATSEGDVEESLLDTFLLQALNHPRDRLTLLKLDFELERFVNSSRQRLDFPPMGSYQRMMVHRVAQYFKLQHTSVESSDPTKRIVVLFKVPESRVPELRFNDLLEQPEPEQAPKNIKIMQRPSDSQRRQEMAKSGNSSSNSPNGNITESEQKSIEEREEAYARARARIFNQDVNGKPKEAEPVKKPEPVKTEDKNTDTTDKAKSPTEPRAQNPPERRGSFPPVTVDADQGRRGSYDENWDSRYSWPRPAEPIVYGGLPPTAPGYWDHMSGQPFDPAVGTEYYQDYFEQPSMPPQLDFVPRSAWPEQPRYLYAPDKGTYVRAPLTTVPLAQAAPYVPHNYGRQNSYGHSESFVNNDVPREGEETLGLAGTTQPWSTQYNLSSTYSPKQGAARHSAKPAPPKQMASVQPTQPQPSPQQTSPQQQGHSSPQGNPRSVPVQKTQQQPQHGKQRYATGQQPQMTLQQPFHPKSQPYKPTTPVPPPAAVYIPPSQYGYYPLDQTASPSWGYYGQGPMPPHGAVMQPTPYGIPVSSEMLPPDNPYGQPVPYQSAPFYPQQHRYSLSGGRTNYLGEYERPPPKSKELFDPSSPSPSRSRESSHQHNHIQSAPSSFVPTSHHHTLPYHSHSSPDLSHYHNAVAPTTPVHQQPTFSPSTAEMQTPTPTQLQQLQPQAKPYSSTSLLVPNKGIKSVKPGATLLYDYSLKNTPETVASPPAQACPPMAVHHILEVYDLKTTASSDSNSHSENNSLSSAASATTASSNNNTRRKGYLTKSKELTEEQEKALTPLREAGATIKFISSSGSVLAIFKNASAANQALEIIQGPQFKLRRWTTPVATPPTPSAVTSSETPKEHTTPAVIGEPNGAET